MDEAYLTSDDIQAYRTATLKAMRTELLAFIGQVAAHPTHAEQAPPHVPAPTHPQTGEPLSPGSYLACSRCAWEQRVAEQRAAIAAFEAYDFAAESDLLKVLDGRS